MLLDSVQESKLYSLLWFFYTFILLLCVHTGAIAHVTSEDSLQVVALSSYHVGSEDQTGVFRIVSKSLTETASKLCPLCCLFPLKQHVTGVTTCFMSVIVFLRLCRTIRQSLKPVLLPFKQWLLL